jgi:hypothetical protein
MDFASECQHCGAVGPRRFGYCEKCRIISPGPLTTHRFALTRRGLLNAAIKVLAFYSPMKDGCVALRNRIASRATAPSLPTGFRITLTFGTPVPKDTAYRPNNRFA